MDFLTSLCARWGLVVGAVIGYTKPLVCCK